MKKLAVSLILIIICFGIVNSQDIQSVTAYYTALGVQKNVTVNTGGVQKIERDKGTQINIKITKKTSAPATSTFTVACLPTGGSYERTSTNLSETFNNVGDALTNDIWCMVNIVSGVIKIQPVDLPSGYPDITPINRVVDGSTSSSYKEFNVGQTVDLECDIWNNGSIAAGSHRTGFYIGKSTTDFSNFIDYNGTGSTPIQPGTIEHEKETYTFTNSDIGTRYINFFADYQNVIAEGTAEGNNKQSWGPFTVKQQILAPTVVFNPASSITPRSVNLSGSVNPNGSATTYYFEFGKTTSYGTKIPVPPASAGSGTIPINVSVSIDYLESGTIYHCRLVATNSGGTSNSNDISFTTTAMTISMTAPSSNITVTPGASVTLTWSGTPSTGRVSLRRDNDNIWDNSGGETWIALSLAASGSYSWNTTGVPSGTYYIAAMITDGSSSKYAYATGTVTIGGVPTVTTNAASNITTRSARINGSVNPNGSATTYYFEYGKTTNYGTKIPASPASAGSGSSALNYSSDVDYLEAGVTYHYRIVATNSSGTSNGSDVTFIPSTFTINMSAPASNVTVAQGASVNLSWSGTPSTESVSLRRDNDNIWDNGGGETWIVLSQAASGSYSWNTTGVPPGTYYIAAMITDGSSLKYAYATGIVTVGEQTGSLLLTVNNINGTSTPLPGNEGRVKLFKSDGTQVGTEQSTNTNGTVTFTNMPVGTGYYAEVYHDPINPMTPFGREFWGTTSSINITSGQTTTSGFTRNQPYGGEIKIFNGTTPITSGQIIPAGNELTVEYTLYNPSSVPQSAKSVIYFDIDKTEPIDYIVKAPSLQSIPANSSIKQTMTFTPAAGVYYAAGGTDISSTTARKFTDGGKWSENSIFTIETTEDVQIISVTANRRDNIGGNHITISKNAFIYGNYDRFAFHLDVDQTNSCLKYLREKLWVQITLKNNTNSQQIKSIYTGVKFPNSSAIQLSESNGWAFALNPGESKLINIPVTPPEGSPLNPYNNVVDGEYEIFFGINKIWPSLPHLKVKVYSNPINPPANASIGNLCSINYNDFNLPPTNIDKINLFLGPFSIFATLYTGVDDNIPTLDQFGDLFEPERTAFAEAAKAEITILEEKLNETNIQTKWKDQPVYPKDRPVTVILFDRATSLLDIKAPSTSNYPIINTLNSNIKVENKIDKNGFKHTIAIWSDYGVDKQLNANQWYTNELSITHNSAIEIAYSVRLEMGPFLGIPNKDENGDIIDYSKWLSSPNEVYWLAISGDYSEAKISGTGIQSISGNLKLNEQGNVEVKIVAPSKGNYYVKVFDDNLLPPNWTWSSRESSLVSLEEWQNFTFNFKVTPTSSNDNFRFLLYKQTWIPGIFSIYENKLQPLSLSEMLDNVIPVIKLNSNKNHWIKSNELLDIDFSDNIALNNVWYQINSKDDSNPANWHLLTNDGVNVLTGSQNNSGTSLTTDWKISNTDWNNLTYAMHYLYFKVTDDAGNVYITPDQASAFTFGKDDKLPNVSFNAPTEGQTFPTNTIQATWYADDLYGGLLLSGLDAFYIAIDQSTNFIQLPESALSHTFNNLQDGNHIIYLKAKDKAGNYSSLKQVSFKVNFVPLAKTLTVAPDSWNYEDVAINNSSDKTFTIKNTGSTTLSVTGLSIAGTNANQFSIINPPAVPFELSANATKSITVRFKPTSNGVKEAAISILNNSDNAPNKSINLKGTGTTSAILSLGNVDAAPNSNVAVPINATNLKNIAGFQFTIDYDASMLTYVSCTNWPTNVNGVTISNPKAGKITFVYSDPNNVMNITSGKFFDLNFNVIAASGTSAISWSDDPTARLFVNSNLETVNCAYNNGSVSIITGFKLSGNLAYDNTNMTPLFNESISLINSSGQSVGNNITDGTGLFGFDGLSNDTYTLKPDVTLPWGNSGVNVTDVLMYKQCIVKSRTLTSFRERTGDVNRSGLPIDVTDVLLIMRRLGDPSKIFKTGDWLYENTTAVINNADINGHNILALCYGDANGSFIPTTNKSALNIFAEGNDKANMLSGNEFEVTFGIDREISNLAAIGLTFSYPDEVFDVTKIKMANNNEDLYYTVIDGTIRIVFATLNAFDQPSGQPLFTVSLKLKEDADFSEIEKSTSIFAGFGEFADVTATEFPGVNVIYAGINNDLMVQLIKNKKVKIYPNPANNFVNITNVENTEISVFDVHGRQVLKVNGNSNLFRLKLDGLNTGVYLISIRKDQNIINEKISIIKQK